LGGITETKGKKKKKELDNKKRAPEPWIQREEVNKVGGSRKRAIDTSGEREKKKKYIAKGGRDAFPPPLNGGTEIFSDPKIFISN
jgi:hypothetical protein